ncbi:ABC transporter ATP-binding protein [Actinocrinis puniceicyclus]|uniref:ABC transporter ATP-binding protein n=1 Tax=Actinocrinis puniceicyclus TaxID=977794 RepID=A0A8J7WRW4_9ACTN|nr:ABC transporter ATP-binding protein [Actinocrinis puniceicyclus]MBS2965555.1 ABC transporter ATP-binding protein [Actinocrinis puniceicyclus]
MPEPAAGRTAPLAPGPAGATPPVGTAPVETPVVELRAVTRVYGNGRTAVHALRGVDMTLRGAKLIVVRGRSGSGKTTLLNIIGGLDLATGGTVRVAGRDLAGLSERERVLMRRDTVGFVFQSFGLIPFLSAAENVGVPLRITNTDPAERDQRVQRALELVGLAGHAAHRPAELSGGQQQRVAIARALVQRPRLLIADEPTGHLDAETALQVMRRLRGIVDGEHLTALVATHDRQLTDLADEVLDLRDGKLLVAQVGGGPQDGAT